MIKDTINHVALVLDGSSSMALHQRNLIKVADELVKHLANRSVEMDQETRVTVYLFNNSAKCLIFDKDVLRLPSIADVYRASGMTALVDATHLSIADLEKTAQMYGDHAFLVYVLTDGEENASRTSAVALREKLHNLPDNWTIAALVPDAHGRSYAQDVGFPKFNVTQWETGSVDGVAKAMTKITTATDNYMVARASGVRGTKNLFQVDAAHVNVDNIVQANMTPVKNVEELIVTPFYNGSEIRNFVEIQGKVYKKGTAYYQLTKPEKVQPGKKIAVRAKATGVVYAGIEARTLLGLPDGYVKVTPGDVADFDVFIQSNSVNRHLVGDTRVLIIK